jgi:hypothetical protein
VPALICEKYYSLFSSGKLYGTLFNQTASWFKNWHGCVFNFIVCASLNGSKQHGGSVVAHDCYYVQGCQGSMNSKLSKTLGYHCKGNVMTPINWFSSVFEGVLIPTGALQHSNWFGIICAVLVFIMLTAYIWAYFYFACKDPNRLQSEEYNLCQQELAISSAGSIQIQKEEPRIAEGSYQSAVKR